MSGGLGLSGENAQEAFKAMNGYANLIGYANMYSSSKSYQAANNATLTDVSKVMGSYSGNGKIGDTTTTETHEEINTHEERTEQSSGQSNSELDPATVGVPQIDYSRLEEVINRAGNGDGDAADTIKKEASRILDEIRKVNSTIQSNNEAIKQLESENQTGQNTILNALQSAGKIGSGVSSQQVVQVLQMGGNSQSNNSNS